MRSTGYAHGRPGYVVDHVVPLACGGADAASTMQWQTIGAATIFIPSGTIGISTILRVGAYEKPIVFQNCQAWKNCARLVAKDIETWLDANTAALVRSDRPSPSSLPAPSSAPASSVQKPQ